MNNDIRISTSIADHPKTRKLLRKLSDVGFRCFIFLLCKAGIHRPEGSFHGMDDVDVEDFADWRGEPGALVQGLLEIGFLDRGDDGVLEIHDWMDWNPYAAKAKERKAHAIKMSNARWEKHRTPEGEGEKTEPAAKPKRKRKKRTKPNGAENPNPDAATKPELLDAPPEDGDTVRPLMVSQAWNRICIPRIPDSKVTRVGPARRAKLATRLGDKSWDWQGALNWIEQNVPLLVDVNAGKAKLHFLSGGGKPRAEGDNPWIASFDWFTRSEEAVIKILENKYSDNKNLPAVVDGPSLRAKAMQKAEEEGRTWAEGEAGDGE